jgi:hypothetical protein
MILGLTSGTFIPVFLADVAGFDKVRNPRCGVLEVFSANVPSPFCQWQPSHVS